MPLTTVSATGRSRTGTPQWDLRISHQRESRQRSSDSKTDKVRKWPCTSEFTRGRPQAQGSESSLREPCAFFLPSHARLSLFVSAFFNSIFIALFLLALP